MAGKRWFQLIVFIACMALVSVSHIDVLGVTSTNLNNPQMPQLATPLTSLDGEESDPDLAYDPALSQFLLVFRHAIYVTSDYTYSIQAQFISNNGTPIGSSLILSTQGSQYRLHPAVAYNSALGEFLVIWAQQFQVGSEDYDIYAQRVSIYGNPVGGIITIDYSPDSDSYPDIAYNPITGEYLAVWERYQSGQSEIYARRLNASGDPIYDGIFIASDSVDESGAAVAYDGRTGEFLVVYHIESDDGNYDIFGQRVSSIGDLSGGLILISTASGNQMDPQLAYNLNTDQYLVVWQDERVYRAIYGQRVNGMGGRVGENFAVADQGSNYRNYPQVAFQLNANEYMVTWSINVPGEDVNIFRRRVPASGVITEPESLVSGESTLERYPVIAAGGGMTYLLAWQDNRDTSTQENIYGSVDNANPGACGGVFIPSADSTVYQDDPSTPHGNDGILLINRGSDPSTGMAYTYLTFELGERIPAEATIHSAELRLTMFQAAIPEEFALQVIGSPQAWDEATLIWDSQPAWQGSFMEKSYYPLWTDLEPVVLSVDVSTLVNLWTTGVYAPTGLALIPGQQPMNSSFLSREVPYFSPQLVVHCSAPAPALPRSYGDVNALQLAGIERLTSQSSVPPMIQLGESGAVRFATFNITAPSTLTDALSRAIWFTQEYADLMRVVNPSQDLQFVRRSPDETDLFFRQRYNGIPVIGSEIGIHLQGEHITGLSGSYLSDLQLDTTPQITAERAREIILATIDTRAQVISEDQLRLLNRTLFGTEETRTFLTWMVVLDVDGGTEYYIDANTGGLRFEQPRNLAGFDLDIETGNHHGETDSYCHQWWWTTDDDHWCDENGCSSDADAEGISTYNNIKTIYNMWKNYLNRDSYDNDGADIQMYIHVGNNWANAQWVCERLEFGEGWSVLDVIGHEFTHAVTDNTSDLVYENESGALNESFSDIFGAFADYNDWLVGEDLPNGAIRSLADPTLYGDPDRFSSYSHQTSDHGGVHTNSGINNKAAYLITTGDDFNGVDLPWGGIGLWRARFLFYKTLQRLSSNASLLDARNAAVATATEFAQQNKYSFTSNQTCIVRNAYHAVELGEGDLDCDGTEDNVDPDWDGDNVGNSQDNCPQDKNPDQQDTNSDGQGDECDNDDDGDLVVDQSDNCPLVANQGQLDTDHDGYGNACDDNDDNDQVPDVYDNCPTVSNWDQVDTDQDSQGDACDSDDDDDGVLDITDNCSLVPNPNQLNSDGDLFGNACDLCPDFYGMDNGDPDNDGKGNSCDADDDNDGVLDGSDNCSQDYNPDQRDIDGDGLGWACDPNDAAALLDKLKMLTLQYYRGAPIRIPLPGCGMCGPGYIDPGYYQTINLVSSAGFYADIVDSSGKIITRSSPEATNMLNQTLSYRPDPFASHLLLEATSSAESADLAADDIRYYLELVPVEGLDLGQDYDLTIQVMERNSLDTFLPVLFNSP